MKKAFTLIELLVVIAIIGILSGVLLATFRGGTESALAARCLTNMKNLAAASQSYGMESGSYPGAGSVETLSLEKNEDTGRTEKKYQESTGWISWDSKGKYPSQSHAQCPLIGFCEQDDDRARYALANGSLWKYVSRNSDTYVCPKHQKALRRRKGGGKLMPRWSYLMNADFGYDTSNGSRPVTKNGGGRQSYGELVNADRRLLFSEIPFSENSNWKPEGSSGSTDSDGVLQYAAGKETIGANHLIGKTLYAHVAFADGHVEKFRIPFTGSVKSPQADDTALKNLTTWLCQGVDVSFDGKAYHKMDN